MFWQRHKIFSWIFAFGIGFVIANFLVSFYFFEPGWFNRQGGATQMIYEPGTRIVRADEGYTVTNVDENGYINESAELSREGYVLVLGNSQSNGNNVMPEDKYVQILNRMLAADRQEKDVCAYNISVGGRDFCDIVSGFDAAIQEFPRSEAVVIQIQTTDLNPGKLQGCTEQRPFAGEDRGSYLKEHSTFKQKSLNNIKNFFPLWIYLWEIKSQTVDLSFEDVFWHQEGNAAPVTGTELDLDEYEKALEEALQFIRSDYDGKIIIVNTPYIGFRADGTIAYVKSETEAVFEELCEKNGVIYHNMISKYQTEYESSHKLPYGFSNTSMGTGHLNKDGHRMVADELYEILKEQ